jgi:hypothetical protein
MTTNPAEPARVSCPNTGETEFPPDYLTVYDRVAQTGCSCSSSIWPVAARRCYYYFFQALASSHTSHPDWPTTGADQACRLSRRRGNWSCWWQQVERATGQSFMTRSASAQCKVVRSGSSGWSKKEHTSLELSMQPFSGGFFCWQK